MFLLIVSVYVLLPLVLLSTPLGETISCTDAGVKCSNISSCSENRFEYNGNCRLLILGGITDCSTACRTAYRKFVEDQSANDLLTCVCDSNCISEEVQKVGRVCDPTGSVTTPTTMQTTRAGKQVDETASPTMSAAVAVASMWSHGLMLTFTVIISLIAVLIM